MFYIRSMTEENRRTGAEPAELGPFAASGPQRGERGEGGLCQPQKRMDGVESPKPRKRGGQPGNRNAVKTGRDTAEAKRLRSMVWQFRRRTKAILAAVNADLDAQKSRRP